ncbi:thiol-disulfide oxidoreductase DCC [Actibacterium atlanticum]|uniref:Thiol-disulfide oxidoreductase DCC n=1 Tax=Actibacterium atlanticum TaxID=1461693 RepID=A0A058ZI67_9RHOB|nr:DCC1-like thiol-disulfide oxidoreductase family protein [Actibacterium atlanticum]KCV81238.1 thiol-disulfide oxidoreductase DCC [Actibacterium atlanticum]
MHPAPRPAYSYKDDPNVPGFDDSRMVLVMDGHCALCSAAARRIARLDRNDTVRIAPAQSALGQALLAHYKLSPEDPETWLTLSEGRARGSLNAMIHLFTRLSAWAAPIRLINVLPRGVQDWLYARIARNRYRLFGRSDLCAMPDPALRARLLE